MTEQEIGAYILIYGFVAIVTTLAFWLGERQERKYREYQRKLHSNLNIIANMGSGETLEQTLARTEKIINKVRKDRFK